MVNYNTCTHVIVLHVPGVPFKVEWYPKQDQRVCLNTVTKDQLRAIALAQRKDIAGEGFI